MEKKNTVLLTVIAVATLLVAVVGATFAYFTATTTPNGNGGNTTATTTTVGNVDLTMAASTTTNDLKYPGGYLVVGASVTAKDTDTANDFNVTYTVNGKITNNTTTALTYDLYEVSSTVATPVTGCTVKEEAGAVSKYYYEGCAVATEITGGTKVLSTQTAAAGETTTVTAAGETLKTSNAGTTTYYYLVVNYPNTEASQNDDQGKTVVASIDSVTEAVSAVAQS